ncbi:MAG: lantibiotic dehydratase [Pseudonocardiales bacterium]
MTDVTADPTDGRTVLRPASWNLSASDLPARCSAWREWSQAWSGLRRRYRIPDLVHLGEQDVIIFHWNRIGLPRQTQANMALAAKEAIFETGRVSSISHRWV